MDKLQTGKKKMAANHTSGQRLVSRIYEELPNLNRRKNKKIQVEN